jgi:hypothetical protein
MITLHLFSPLSGKKCDLRLITALKKIADKRNFIVFAAGQTHLNFQ